MKRPKWLTFQSIVFTALVVACSALGYEQRKTRQVVEQLRWEADLREHSQDQSTISLDVGVIQFLKNGYSIRLDTVETTPAGVVLVGQFGNPRALTLSSVTLGFAVELPMWKFRDLYEKDRYGLLFSDTLNVAKAQTLAGDVPAGGTARFRVVVPDVKGDLKNYVVTVGLSGERYQYLR